MRWGFNPYEPTGIQDPVLPRTELPDHYRVETVVSGLDRPTQLAAAADGRLFVAEQAGDVRVVRNGQLLAEPFISVDAFLPDLDKIVELGLTGIVVDPQFEEYPYVYLYYAADNPRRTVIVRVQEQGGRGTNAQEIFSWERAPECCHIGGGMRFLRDGTILVGMGDHEQSASAQNPLEPPGSILRITREGGWPDDNPFIGPVYAYGLRNPYDVAADPGSGRIFAGENGLFGQDAIVEIEAGANYGWPGTGLREPLDEIEHPLIFYHEGSGTAGLEFYSSPVLGELQGHLLFCRFHSGEIHDVDFAADGSVARETVLDLEQDCHSDLLTGPEGFLYFLDFIKGTLYRIAAGGES
ncbi:MAG: PQQ-dependent sugar dehydrogenase [Dehalococcoidia bacterium]|nr:PQQ-dependent sugar dehydrogenase [Dehalococcoidia bacterium]